MSNTDQDPSLSSDPREGGAAFIRFGWMAGGSIAMLITAMSIARVPSWTIGWRDGVFWIACLATAALRYLDIARFHGQTAEGQPASAADFRRYLVGLVSAASLTWALVQSLHI